MASPRKTHAPANQTAMPGGGVIRGQGAPPAGGGQVFIRPLETDGALIGGKARSLARLAALGLPIPAGFAISADLFQTLRATAPPLPARLQVAADLAALDTARAAIGRAPFPPGFHDQLNEALDRLGRPPIQFSVRSSAATEDRPGALGAGVFSSVLRVSRDTVVDAVRQVLASFLTPAAWVYTWRREPRARADHNETTATTANPAPVGPGIGSVLIHVFADGEAGGTAACDPAAVAAAGEADVRIDVAWGTPTEAARAAVAAAARGAAAAHGAVEIEWVARGDHPTFLQLRAYQPAPTPRGATVSGHDHDAPRTPVRFTTRSKDTAATAAFVAAVDPTQPGGPWTWDAAHNPLPLSPAQAGLVELVDARCRIGIRQKLVGGYLFYRQDNDRDNDRDDRNHETDARAAFDRLRAAVGTRLDDLGGAPSLPAAIDAYVWAYQPLFGVVGRACAAARQALATFLGRHAPGHPAPRRLLAHLLTDVPSLATARRQAAGAIAAATDTQGRQRAIDAYLLAFGDESPRWDVAEPTLREDPARLLLLAAARDTSAGAPDRAPDTAAGAAWREALAALQARLPAAQQTELEGLVATARAAVAVGEDDDALFARLQAVVRRALLALGQRLDAAGALDAAEDVFFLPLSQSLSLSDSLEPPFADQRAAAAYGRTAFHAAALAPPVVPRRTGAGVVRGLAGAGGQAIGRVAHHPAAAPLNADAILIAATLLPTELPLLAPGAIVVETGSVLDHVAAQARERGIPAVVGAPGARAALPEGATVVVDGDEGTVILVDLP
ncbi:MAG: PEP/pyruvate-binding domain-containing protein [Pseudomonadota bacterium]